MTAWTDAVKKAFKEGKAKSATYTLKNAMLDAKKIYRSASAKVGSIASSRSSRRKRSTRRRRR
jgi:hypothetical protein